MTDYPKDRQLIALLLIWLQNTLLNKKCRPLNYLGHKVGGIIILIWRVFWSFWRIIISYFGARFFWCFNVICQICYGVISVVICSFISTGFLSRIIWLIAGVLTLWSVFYLVLWPFHWMKLRVQRVILGICIMHCIITSVWSVFLIERYYYDWHRLVNI